MCPAVTSTAMPSGYLHSVTMTLRSEPSGFSETTRSLLSSKRNRRPAADLLPDGCSATGVCELTICLLQILSWDPNQLPDSLCEVIPSLSKPPTQSMCLLTGIDNRFLSAPTVACAATR